jgi:mannose/cellobiose epimerase-like protein (N-acyl-D-glucosamine 2-epimerase family)
MIDLVAETDRLLHFAEGSRHPDGGFAWLRSDGTPDLSRPRELWITTRMTHCFALGALLGRPGARELVEHGLASLRDDFRDRSYGGWFAQVGGSTDKRAYEHVFVVLAAASAGDAELLGEALEVLETRFWDERAGALVDVYNRDWTALEPYRGANANMHGVEAMLATEDPVWVERARRVTQRLVVDNHPMLNEHFDAGWRPLPDYNLVEPAHPFRPYGATIGHWFEWARLAYTQGGFEDDARRLFAAGVRDGWDGSGFVYTVDWDARPVVADRLHWVLCEAICAAAVLGEDALQAAWWELAERHFIDRAGGSWRHELDPSNQPSSTVWDGKPDVYHALQATLIPRLPVAPSLAAALRRSAEASSPPR